MPQAKATSDENLDMLFHALADKTRRALLEKLRHRPAKVTALAAPFDMSLPAVSKHLRVLEHAGLIKREIVGREHLCTLDANALVAAENWLNTYRIFWQQSLASLDDYLQTEKISAVSNKSKSKRTRGARR